ncbi:MAG: ACT domain-containing protein [Pseudomonadota bacterium]
MKNYYILSLVGLDRPGVADETSAFLFDRGANIEDSRMASMGGRFAVMVLFSCSSAEAEKIKADGGELTGRGFEFFIHDAQDPAGLTVRAELPLKIRVMAMDHPGIVKNVVGLLNRFDVNIQSLNTKVQQAPWSGTPLFDLYLRAGVPKSASIVRVKDELSRLAAEMNLDLTFKE